LTFWQKQHREKALKLVQGDAPYPWQNHQMLGAAGIFAAGWTKNSEFLMLSGDGYSLTNPLTGKLILFEVDEDKVYDNLDEDTTEFRIPSTGETIRLFGLHTGDGVKVIRDWSIEIIYPVWPNSMVILEKSSKTEWEKKVSALKIEVTEAGGWRSCGFSPSHKSFAVVGHAGVDFFSRVD
jgi:hypothetical protein